MQCCHSHLCYSKETILSWERRFPALHGVRFLSTLVHECLALVIEGDDAYTNVKKHVPPDQSPGWTRLLIDRASRFMGALDCGKKDRRIFKKARKILDTIVRKTDDLRICTDGERR